MLKLNERRVRDLKKLIEYAYEDEERHYQECLFDQSEYGGCPASYRFRDKHIFAPIRRLKQLIDKK